MPAIKSSYPIVKKKVSGALSVEAALVFPVLIIFILLMASLIRISYINIVLNHAVSETARHLASAAYPVALLNELEDELTASNPDLIEIISKDDISITDSSDINSDSTLAGFVTSLYTSSPGNNDLTALAGTAFDEISGLLMEKAEGAVIDLVKSKTAEKYISIKQDIKQLITASLVKKLADSPGFDARRISVFFVSLPQSYTEYDVNQSSSGYIRECNELGYHPGIDDVVIAAEYSFKIPVPFMKNREKVIRCIAIERAWLNGSNGINAEGSGSDNDEDTANDSSSNTEYYRKPSQSETVYVTRTGIRYHKSGCRYLARSRIPYARDKADEKGYTPCKVCYGQ